jgi:nucleoside-diphosphate-sugar epimerase
VLVDETWPQEPISGYGRGKVECERIFRRAHEERKFHATIVRPSSTYGPGNSLIDQLEFNPSSWDRIEKGLPVLCAGDGLGLWVSTHRDDCSKLFAYAALNRKTYGQDYNATRDEVFTWRDHFRQAAAALGKKAQLLFMPAAWIIQHNPERFGLLREITQYHGAYTSAKAKRDVPEFRCKIGFERGAAETLADVKRRGAWRDSSADTLYQELVEKALKLGVQPVEA